MAIASINDFPCFFTDGVGYLLSMYNGDMMQLNGQIKPLHHQKNTCENDRWKREEKTGDMT